LRVAIVHDKLVQLGGAERVALELRRLWPEADLYVAAYDPDLARAVGVERVQATFLQRMPGGVERTRWLLPFYDLAFRSLRLNSYDAVISSAAMFAKSVRPRGGPHVCYCHTPVVYLWHLRDTHIRELPYPWPVRAAAAAAVPWLRRRDRRAADGVDLFVANSRAVAHRIARYYGRRAEVVHPPVDAAPYAGDFERGDYLLVVARLYPYKRVDLAIEACNRLRLPLRIVGEGPDRRRLEALAGPTVEFLGWVPEKRKPELFGAARALVAPQEEDFGIVIVEALAAGTPVVALAAGGALDIVEDGETGILFAEQTAGALARAIERLDSFEPGRAPLRERASRFAPAEFDRRMRAVVERAMAGERSPAAHGAGP
jgi:glycosyltransferase involved in cell wall biosynthesis